MDIDFTPYFREYEALRATTDTVFEKVSRSYPQEVKCQPHCDDCCYALFDLTFIRQKGNVVFLGPPGVGKTHLAVSLALKACQAGLSIYFTNMEDLIKKLRKDHEAGRPGKGRSYYKSSLVVVDEVGYTPINREECNLFFRFIANRYEKTSTVITSNKAFSDWTELFHDPIIVTAVLDRLLHHSVVINIKGNSYRLKGKMKEKELNELQKVN